MGVYDRILVPTDGSDGGERAVQHAVDLAVAHGATIHALYVINAASFAGLPTEASLEGVDEMLRADADDAVATVEAIADDYDVPCETAIRDGDPSKRIVQYAEAEDCDLIVMATHGRGGIDRLLLGSTAEAVIRSAEVPVTTIRLTSN
jgi:nucleotide-binding universal stress UspA family protein